MEAALRRVLIHNLSRPEQQPLEVQYCESFACRLRGLTFRRKLDADDGLLLVGSRQSRVDTAIHMLFVWFDIGVAWLDANGVVVDTCLARSWRPVYVPKAPAQHILEMSPDASERFKIGEQTRFERLF